MLKIGDKAPEVLGLDQNGKEVKISDFGGKKIVLYFYPKDSTPGCTAEACSLRDGLDDLKDAGYAVVGVSKDSAKSHQNFIAKQNLNFPLISDQDKNLIEYFGVWGEKKMCGKTCFGVVRTTFILAPDGTVENIITNVNTKDAAKQILELK